MFTCSAVLVVSMAAEGLSVALDVVCSAIRILFSRRKKKNSRVLLRFIDPRKVFYSSWAFSKEGGVTSFLI